MALIRRRYYIWLARAYLKRWKKTIFTSIFLGGIIFFILFFILDFYLIPSFEKKIQKIGYVGTYSTYNLPEKVLKDVSFGLTYVGEDGKVKPAAAYRWQVKNDGKDYVFYLKKGQYFHDNKELTAKNININFKDVKKKIIDDYTIDFVLKDPYSPFLVSVSRPIFEGNFQGLGESRIKKIESESGFVKSMVLENVKNPSFKKIIYFYPTQDALKMAFALGEVDYIYGVSNANLDKFVISSWKNAKATNSIDYSELVSLFYNNSDSTLSNKKVRQALNFATPARFAEGERAYSPISPKSFYYSKPPNSGISDIDLAKTTLDSIKDTKLKEVEISTPEDLVGTASLIRDIWTKLDIKVKVKIIQEIPNNYQVLLYPIKLPIDPDQYTLWHSDQVNNIVHYKNLRIDKLLEDGRTFTDPEKRFSIYSDLQKYLTDDVPASFLYFPKKLIIERN